MLATLLLLGACEEEKPAGIPLCTECGNAMSCPGAQPGINPLEVCDTPDDECFYCSSAGMRRFVCQGGGDTDGDLRWRDNGVPEMCPPPSDDTTTAG